MKTSRIIFVNLEGTDAWRATTPNNLVGDSEAAGVIPSYVTRLLNEIQAGDIIEIGPYLVAEFDPSGAAILRIQETGEEDRFTMLAAFESANEEDEETLEIARGLKVGDSVPVGFGWRIERVL